MHKSTSGVGAAGLIAPISGGNRGFACRTVLGVGWVGRSETHQGEASKPRSRFATLSPSYELRRVFDAFSPQRMFWGTGRMRAGRPRSGLPRPVARYRANPVLPIPSRHGVPTAIGAQVAA